MQPYIQRQHLLLSEKNNSPDSSWQQLQRSVALPSAESDQLAAFKPTKPINLASHWYLVAKQNAFREQPTVALSMQYPVALLVISIVVFSIINFRVMPALTLGFDTLSAPLPEFTLFIYQYYLLICGATLLLLGGLTAAVYFINHAAKNMTKIPVWLEKLKPLQQWVRYHNHCVIGHKLQAWMVAAVPLTETDLAGLISNQEWQLAQQQNTLAETLKAATPQFNGSVVADTNQQLTTLSTAILGPVIGAFVVAIYLPIFQLGSIA